MKISFLFIILTFFFIENVKAQDPGVMGPEIRSVQTEDSSKQNKLTFTDPKISNSDILFSQFGGSATVITENDIKKSGASDVQELLRKIPGLSIKQSGGRGGVASIFSRGSESDHNLVIIDGVKINEIGGYYDFSRLSVNNIEQIEVLRGPQAALYGPGAMGSVISIKTKKFNEKNTISFNTAFGLGESPSRGLQSNGGRYFINEQTINISGPILIDKNNDYLRFGYSLGFKRIDDNGHMLKNNNHDKGDLISGLSLFTADNKLKIQASFTKKKVRYHYPTDSSGNTEGTPFLNTQKDIRHITTRSLNFEYKVANPLTLGTTYKYWYMHIWVESGYQAWNGVETNSDTNFWEKREGFDYYARHSKDFNKFTINSLVGYESTTESSDYNTFGGTYYGHDDEIKQYYGNVNFKLPSEISINPGVRKIHHETHGGYTLPSIFASKNFSETSTRIRGGFSKGVKYPNTYESYSQSYMLRPERQKSYEVGFDQNIKRNIILSATYFDTKIYDLITYTGWVTGTQSGAIYQNIQEASSDGIELSSLIMLPQSIKAKIWYTYLKTNVDRNDNYGGDANWPDNKDLLRRPRKSGGFTLRKSNQSYNISLDGSYTGGRWDYQSSNIRLWNKPFWNFDFYAEHNIDNFKGNYNLRPFIKIKNIFNDERQEILNFESPGRTSMIGIKGEI